MAFPVVEFSRQGYKIRKVFGKKSISSKDIKKCKNLTFKVKFLRQKSIWNFSFKNIDLGAHFL
jgi:hypothetical protein